METATEAKVLEIVRATREILLPRWGKAEQRIKGGERPSLVTEFDLTIERYLADALEKIDPGATFAGEEFGGARDHERLWLCDPIDGTIQFVRGLPGSSVMLALIEEGTVNFSVIYDFLNDDLYHASRGNGAYKNDERIHVSERPLSQAIILFESRADRPELYDLRKRLRQKAILTGSTVAGSEFLLVATGKFDGRINIDPYGRDWDFAPGAFLVEEAGGIVSNIGSKEYDYRNVDLIAANPLVYRALTEGKDAFFPVRS